MNGDLKFKNMGQNSSLPKQRKISLRSPFPRRSKTSQQASLSHTFTFIEDLQTPELININFATEEELMTLPGISRNIAKSIVEHRKAIGRFKKVEDLALVRGIGADKLELIRPEICASKSFNSSRAPSVDSLKSTDSVLRQNKLVNVNQANVFELQCVHGITQEMAAAIVHYRNKKGPFKQIDDLIKVKSIDSMRLSNIRQYLCVRSEDKDSLDTSVLNGSHSYTNGFLKNGLIHNSSTLLENGSVPGATSRPRRKSGMGPIKINGTNGLLPSSLQDIYELLSAYSTRPILEEEFKYRRNNKPAVRIGTWNLHQFSNEKAHNLGVKEVVCRTILENRWSIVAVQEVLEVEALRSICDELNNPTLNRIRDWKENSQNWNFCMLDTNLGFIYDMESGGLTIELQSLQKVTSLHDVQAIFTELKINGLKVALINIQINNNLNIENVSEIIQETISQADCFIILGDFKDIILDKMEQRKDLGGLQCIIPINTNTGFPSVKNKYFSNILVTQSAQTKLTGTWGIIKQGLTHLAIPNGWSWGGPVSPHCPLWVEIYATPLNGSVL